MARPGSARRPARRTVAALALGVLCGCTAAQSHPTEATPAARPTASASATAATPEPPAPPAPRREPRTPLALAAHPTRPPIDVSRSLARAVVAGRVEDWGRLGGEAGPLRLFAAPEVTAAPAAARQPSAARAVAAVHRRPDALAVLPAGAAGPGLRLLTVDGVHPTRDPAGYPLTVPGEPPRRVVTMVAVGDVMPARRVGRAMAAAGDFTGPFRPTAGRLHAADLTIGNLESTLSRIGEPRQGDDSFGADPRALRGLRLAGFDVLSVANNHVGDYGPQSLVETLRLIRRAGIATVGAGPDAATARRPAVVERGGVRFGFLAFNAIGETPAPTADRPGAVRLRMQPRTGPLHHGDLATMLADVRALRRRVDVLVVLPHWGQQYTAEAGRDQRVVGRALVDAGADVVVGGHPHWVQGAELHRGRLIAYSLGNFVFDMDFSAETQEGVVLDLVFWDGRLRSAEFVPYRIGRDLAPRFLRWPRGAHILERMWAASGPPFSAGAGS